MALSPSQTEFVGLVAKLVTAQMKANKIKSHRYQKEAEDALKELREWLVHLKDTSPTVADELNKQLPYKTK